MGNNDPVLLHLTITREPQIPGHRISLCLSSTANSPRHSGTTSGRKHWAILLARSFTPSWGNGQTQIGCEDTRTTASRRVNRTPHAAPVGSRGCQLRPKLPERNLDCRGRRIVAQESTKRPHKLGVPTDEGSKGSWGRGPALIVRLLLGIPEARFERIVTTRIRIDEIIHGC